MNWALLQNSLLVSSAATVLAVVFGFLAAVSSCGLSARFRNCVLGAGAITLALPPFLVTNSWLHFLGHTGVWRSWLPFNVVSPGGAVWILALLTWPITLFLIWSAWQQIEPAQLEADPAVTGWNLVRGLLLPVARGPLALGAMLTFVLNLNNFAVPAILQLKVLPDEVWIRFNTLFDADGALRLSWPLILSPLVLVLWIGSRRMNWPRAEQTVSPRLFRLQLGQLWFSPGVIITAVVCLLAGLPIIQILTVKRTWIEFSGALAASQSALWNSIWLSATTGCAIIALALLPRSAVVLDRWNVRIRRIVEHFGYRGRSKGAVVYDRTPAPKNNRFNFSNLLNASLWLPFLVPGVLLGIVLILIFNRPGLFLIYQSAAIVILALTIRYLAIAWTSIRYAVDSVDRDLLESAQLCGASKWQMLRSILWPQIGARLSLTWYILFLFCLWDVETTILIMPPGLETMAFRIFNLLHYGHNSQINALCLILLIVALTPLILWTLYTLARNLPLHISRNALLLFAAVLVLTSCSPAPPGTTALSSQLFSHVQVIGTRGVGVGQLNKPRSVAVDAADNLFVVDMTGRVQKFAPDGRFLLSWQMPQTDLGKPKGMCRDPEGNILVVEPHYQRVNKFSPQGKLLAQWGSRGTNNGQFVLPRAVAVNSRNEIFVSEYEAKERVQKFQLGGIFLGAIGHAGNGPGEFNRPEGICVDSQDRIYVADSCNHRIEIFSRDGKFLRAHGRAGNGPGELSYPYDICVDKAGRQYVCEFGNSRIQVFDSNDKPIEIIGHPGGEPGCFANPWGVALDSAGNLCVADSQNHRVQKLIRRKSVASNQRSVDEPTLRSHNDQLPAHNL